MSYELLIKVIGKSCRGIRQTPWHRKNSFTFGLNLLNREVDDVTRFATAITSLREEIRFCKKCHNISDIEICQLCSNPSRDNSTLCVVEDIRDVMAIENTQQYRGLYHVLGGVISPMDGIGPQHLNIESLIDKVNSVK